LIGTADEATYLDVFNWWHVATTLHHHTNGNNIVSVAFVPAVLGARLCSQVCAWLSAYAQRMFNTAIPAGPANRLTNTTFANTITDLNARVAKANTSYQECKDHHNTEQTFRKHYLPAVLNEMLHIMGVADEEHLPVFLCMLAKHKKKAEDIPYIRVSINERTDSTNSMADEYTLPVLGMQITQLTRDWRLTNLNEELSSGLEWHSHGIPKMLCTSPS
jgi:hypothetical protein